MTTYGNNVAGNISGYFQDIYEDALLVTRENNIITQLVYVPPADRNESESRKLSRFTGATINDISDQDDMASQAFTPSVISTLTPSMKGAQYFITDQRINSSPFDERSMASQDLGAALATKIETDLIGNFTSLTGGTVGTAGTVNNWAYFYAMEAILRAKKAPYPYYFLCHPYQWFPLSKAASVGSTTATNAAPELLNAVNSGFFVQRVGNIYVFVSANIPVISGDDAYCAMFSRSAMAFDIRRAPRLEPERDASKGGGGWELNLTVNYAHGVWRPEWGVQGVFDCSIPTGA